MYIGYDTLHYNHGVHFRLGIFDFESLAEGLLSEMLNHSMMNDLGNIR